MLCGAFVAIARLLSSLYNSLSSLPEKSKSKPMATVILSAESIDWVDHGSFRLMVQTMEKDEEGWPCIDVDHRYLRMRSHKGMSRYLTCM